MALNEKFQKNGEKVKTTLTQKDMLDLEALDKVTGGVSLRDVKKVETTDVSDDTKSKA